MTKSIGQAKQIAHLKDFQAVAPQGAVNYKIDALTMCAKPLVMRCRIYTNIYLAEAHRHRFRNTRVSVTVHSVVSSMF